MIKFKKYLISLLMLFSVSFTSSCSIFGSEEGMMFEGFTIDNDKDGNTILTLTFTDDDIEPLVITIPKGEKGDEGEKGPQGVGISTITSSQSEDGLKTLITVTYTDETLEDTTFEVNNGVSVISIESAINEVNNTTLLTFTLSDGTTKDIEVRNGKDGVGIKDVTYAQDPNGDYIVTITYTDDREPTIITLPYKNGEDGRGISSVVGLQDGNNYVITVYFTNGEYTELAPIDLPEATKWLYGYGAPSSYYERQANNGDYYFDIDNLVIYLFDGEKFNEVIDLTTDQVPSKTYSVTFDANGGEFVSTIPTTITVTADDLTCTLNIKVYAINLRVEEAKQYRVEAESLDLSNIIHDGNPNHYENSPDFSSGGINVGHIASGYFSVYFTTNEKMTLNALLKIAHPSGNRLGEKVTSITIDGTEVTYDKEIILDSAPGNQYWNYKDVALPCGELEAGLHELRFNFNGGAGNIDCIDLTFTK